MCFRERNINKFLAQYKEVLGFNIELVWDSLRRKNRHVLIVNTGQLLKDELLYKIILGFVNECVKQNYFMRIEFMKLFPDPNDSQEQRHLNEYWILKIIQDTRNRNIFQDPSGNLVISFL